MWPMQRNLEGPQPALVMSSKLFTSRFLAPWDTPSSVKRGLPLRNTTAIVAVVRLPISRSHGT